MSESALDGITSVLNAASNAVSDESVGNIADVPIGATGYVPTVEEMLLQGADELSNPAPPKRKRGRPRGSKNSSRSSSPGPEMSGEDMTRAYITKLGQETAADRRTVLLRKKIYKMFDYFPHKLSKYYQRTPDVASMSLQQLIDTDQLLLNIIDEADESVYVKEGFKTVAAFVENAGPMVQNRFLRWMPGSDILLFQEGLGDAVEELVEVPGEEGMADEVNRISLDFIGWAPTNPYANAGLKLLKVMKEIKAARIDELNKPRRVEEEEEDGL